jgi:hypothetical protein
MMKMFALVCVAVLGLAAVAGAVEDEYEEPDFTVVAERDGYEVRKYAPFLIAEVHVKGPYGRAMNQGFQILAGYIFGGNAGQTQIPMTTPVFQEDIVEDGVEGEQHRVIFVLPKDKTLENLPKPNDERVKFSVVPEGYYAVTTFNFWATEQVAAKHKATLLEAMAGDGLTPQGEDLVAQYNEPWTRGDLRRNEVLIPVAREDVEKLLPATK